MTRKCRGRGHERHSLRLTEALDQGQSAIHFRIRVTKLFATLFLDEVAGAVNRQLRRDVVKDGTQLKLGPYQNRIGLAPREEHRKFELAQTPDPVPVGERIGRTRVLFQRVKANQRRRQGLVGGAGWIRTPGAARASIGNSARIWRAIRPKKTSWWREFVRLGFGSASALSRPLRSSR